MIQFPLRNIEKDGHLPKCKKKVGCSCWKAPAIIDDKTIKVRDLHESVNINGHSAWGVKLDENDIIIDVDVRNDGDRGISLLHEDYPELNVNHTYTVDTGRGDGSLHLYFKTNEKVKLKSHLKKYKGVEFRRFGDYVTGVGSKRWDNGNYYTVIKDVEPALFSPNLLKDLLIKEKTLSFNKPVETSNSIIRNALFSIPVSDYHDYHDWLLIGRAVYVASNGSKEGFESWVEWSRQDNEYTNESLKEYESKWKSFRGQNIIDSETLWHHAAQYDLSFACKGVFDNIEPPMIEKKTENDEWQERTTPKEWIYITKLDGFVHKKLRDMKSADKLQLELSYCLEKKKIKDYVNDGTIKRAVEIDYVPNQPSFIRGPLGFKAFNMWTKPLFKPDRDWET